jgi:hypothetical protein
VSGAPEIGDDLQRRLDLWKGVGAVVWCAVLGWIALVRGQRVPVLGFADVATHELGHVVWWQLTHNELVMLVMGNGTQVLVPLLAGIAFFVVRRNWIALGMCLAWCAAAIADTAVYVYDAPRGELTLMGFGGLGDGDQALGDWARVLGPEHLDKLYLADRWAADLRLLAVLVWIAAVAVIGVGLAITVERVRRDRRTAVPTAAPAPVEAPGPRLRTGPSAPGFSFPDRPR